MSNERKTFTRFSSEYDGMREYYLDDGSEVPIHFTEPKEYIPEYDFETSSIKHWWFKNESVLYLDVHTEIARFRSRTTVGKYWKAFRKVWLHKHLWRYL